MRNWNKIQMKVKNLRYSLNSVDLMISMVTHDWQKSSKLHQGAKGLKKKKTITRKCTRTSPPFPSIFILTSLLSSLSFHVLLKFRLYLTIIYHSPWIDKRICRHYLLTLDYQNTFIFFNFNPPKCFQHR